ncbi:GIY-YIG nuclease family protein [Ectothiorhodospiraceae bacterium WFHF3C12]|nr:GIY-YIG nuclease family protein [Ectothiorhodospiraceae bacterium WFHF3C12]
MPGSYLLVLRLVTPRTVTVGRLGSVAFPAGLHVYAGSARGPGGVAARLGRHLRGTGRRRWHVDYLRVECTVAFAAFSTGEAGRECPWARLLVELGGHEVSRGFGASDCRCPTHLLAFPDDEAGLRRVLAEPAFGLQAWVDGAAAAVSSPRPAPRAR